MPYDVRGDIETLLAEYAAGQRGHGYTHRLSNRRNRHRFNSYGFAVDELKKLLPRNLAYLNPDEMAERGLINGDWTEIDSDNGTIDAMVEADETISTRSEEHTSELQSLMRKPYAVFSLKKKNTITYFN